MIAAFSDQAFDYLRRTNCLRSILAEEAFEMNFDGYTKAAVTMGIAVTAAPAGMLWHTGELCVKIFTILVGDCEFGGLNWVEIEELAQAILTDLHYFVWGALAAAGIVFGATLILDGELDAGLTCFIAIPLIYALLLPNPASTFHEKNAEIKRQRAQEELRQKFDEAFKGFPGSAGTGNFFNANFGDDFFGGFPRGGIPYANFGTGSEQPRAPYSDNDKWEVLLGQNQELLTRDTGERTDDYKKYRQLVRDRSPPHVLLDVAERPTEASLKKAFRKASMAVHPDRNRDWRKEAEAITQCINEAKLILDKKLSF